MTSMINSDEYINRARIYLNENRH